MTMTAICSDKLTPVFITGYSVKGGAHKRDGKPNQDSFVIGHSPFVQYMAVADGLGSHKYSKKGSRAICKAVKMVAKQLSSGQISENVLTDRIYEFYRASLNDKIAEAAGTTCLFCIVTGDKLYIGQAGDGICCVCIDGNFKMTGKKREGEFTNEVCAVSGKGNVVWRFRTIDISEASTLDVLLMTDGISEDVIPEKCEGFMHYVMGEDGYPKKRIKKMLKYWETPGSADDKTMTVARWRR